MAQQQNPYYGTGFYQPSGTYVQPQQMTAGQQQQQQAMQQQAGSSCASPICNFSRHVTSRTILY